MQRQHPQSTFPDSTSSALQAEALGQVDKQFALCVMSCGQQSAKNCLSNIYIPVGPRSTSPTDHKTHVIQDNTLCRLCAPICFSRAKGECRDGVCLLVLCRGRVQNWISQYLWPQGESQEAFTPLANVLILANKSSHRFQALFQLLLLSQSLGQVSLCMCPLREISQFPTVPSLSWTRAQFVFKARYFGGLALHCRSQGLKCLMWGPNSLFIREKLWVSEIPPLVHCHTWGWYLVRLCLCLSYQTAQLYMAL